MTRRCALAFCLLAACGGGDAADVDASGTGADAADPLPDAMMSLPDAAMYDADTRPLPDIMVGIDRLRADLAVDVRTFAADACELDPQEDCIGGPGERTLLRFAVETPNIGNADLFLGTPNPSNPLFQYSGCHDHYHYEGYANFELRDAGSEVAAAGHKQAFCLLDSERYIDEPDVSMNSMYHCGYQGIQRGWSDVYHSRLPCQFIDITGVAPGDYTLHVVLNENQSLEELSYANNVVDVPVTIGSAELAGPTEDCPAELAAHATTGSHRECGWTKQQTYSCTPGVELRIGCSSCNSIGTCTGDPMIRVCDASVPGGNCTDSSRLAANDDSCSLCPRAKDFDCPASGMVDVFVGAAELGEAYTCNLAIIEL
jgi:hypothetical protein